MKPILLAQIRCREQEYENSESVQFNPEDISFLKGRYGHQDQDSPQVGNKFVRREPESSPYSKNKTLYNPKRAPSVRENRYTLPTTPNKAILYPRRIYVQNHSINTIPEKPSKGMRYTAYSGKREDMTKSVVEDKGLELVEKMQAKQERRVFTCVGSTKRRPNLINRKLAQFNKVLSRINDECGEKKKGRSKLPDTKNELLMEEYKQQRFKRTLNILEEIDTTDPHIVSALYKYKLRSQLNFEEEVYTIKDHLKEMLRDPRRPVAKIEKQKRMSRKANPLFHRRARTKVS